MSLAALPAPSRETASQRVRRLQVEAQDAARDHSRELIAALAAVEALSMEIAVQGAPYLPGVVNEARLQAVEASQRIERLTAIMARAR